MLISKSIVRITTLSVLLFTYVFAGVTITFQNVDTNAGTLDIHMENYFSCTYCDGAVASDSTTCENASSAGQAANGVWHQDDHSITSEAECTTLTGYWHSGLVAGFQIKFVGISVTKISGGTTGDAGLNVSFSHKCYSASGVDLESTTKAACTAASNLWKSTLLAFSMTGGKINIGSAVLFNLEFTDYTEDSAICFGEDTGWTGSHMISNESGEYVPTVWDVCYCPGNIDDCGVCDSNDTNNNTPSTGTCGCAAIPNTSTLDIGKFDNCGMCFGGSCSDASGTCSDTQYTDKTACEGASKTWTRAYPSQVTCEAASATSTWIAYNSSSCTQDCAGTWGGLLETDLCGTCGGACVGADKTCDDCKTCNGTEYFKSSNINGLCSDSQYTDKTTCEGASKTWTPAAGLCSDSAFIDKSTCVAGGGTWTPSACNKGDQNCLLPDNSCDCEDHVLDCAGVCAGSGVEDCAGVCAGTAVEDCAEVCAGSGTLDGSGACCPSGTLDCTGECDGLCSECDTAGNCCETAGCLSIFQISSNIPTEFTISQNYPNPFNPVTSISFDVPKTDEISLSVYDLAGKKIITLASGKFMPGSYIVNWDATNNNGHAIASGMYVYRYIGSDKAITRKMLYLK